MMEKTCHVFLNNYCVVDYWFELLMDGDDDINEAVNQQLDAIWLLNHRHVARDL